MEPLKLSYNWHYKNDSVPINRNMSPQTTVKLCPLQMNSEKLQENWKQILIGQDHVIEAITPYIIRGLAGLTDPERPIGIFLLLGPTGTGKTKTPETLAKILHGSEKNILHINCAEFQLEHEIAKLIGAPPGYVGHRETPPIFSTTKLNSICSEKCNISIILMDEIEKANDSFHQILLGIMDKGTVRLSDNTNVSLIRSIIFMSSNLGAREIDKLFKVSYGFNIDSEKNDKIEDIARVGKTSIIKKFSPEFANRIDESITFHPLTPESLLLISKLELEKINNLVSHIFGLKSFKITYDDDVLNFIVDHGTSNQYGARELKRVISRNILNPLADEIINEKILTGSIVHFYMENNAIFWKIYPPLEFETESTVIHKIDDPIIEIPEKKNQVTLLPWKAPKQFL